MAEGKDPRGNKYERSYEVLDGNQQLREMLLLKVGRVPRLEEIRRGGTRSLPGRAVVRQAEGPDYAGVPKKSSPEKYPCRRLYAALA